MAQRPAEVTPKPPRDDVVDVELHRERLAELKVTNQMGLETVKEFWCNPDIRLGFKAWWISISTEEERLNMIRSAHAAAHMLLEIENIDEENFIEFNEMAALRIQLMVTRELQEEQLLAGVGPNGESMLLDVLDLLVQGKENEQLTTPLSPELMAQIDDELQQELRLLSLLTPDIQEMGSTLLIGAIFDRLEQRYCRRSLAVIPFLVQRQIECLARAASADKKVQDELQVLIKLIVESLPHTRTFSLTRFFACLINEFIQVIMVDPEAEEAEAENAEEDAVALPLPPEPPPSIPEQQLLKRCDYCGHAKGSIKKCSRCRLRQYCGKECQLNHWKLIHREECRILEEQNRGSLA